MNYRWDKKYLYWGITAFCVIVLSISFFLWLFKFDEFLAGVGILMGILMPFIYGFSFAYLLDPIMNMFEKKAFIPLCNKSKKKLPNKLPRIVALTITLILALAFISSLILMVFPQLIESIKGIISNSSGYFENLKTWALDLVSTNAELEAFLENKFDDIGVVISDFATKNLLPQLDNILSGITSGVFGVLGFFKNIFLGIIISVYVLYSKEKFFAQSKKITYSLFSIFTSNKILKITRRSHRVFGGFIVGKLIDSLIIGIMCFIGMSIFKMQYPLLISVIIGVTNVIPFFGPFIGAIPSGILLLMIDPLMALYFGIFVLALQQFDGNILGPKILGDSTGLSAFWVIFAILVAGGMFGFVGMLIGVPAFAVIYSIIVEFTDARLAKKNLSSKTDDYAKIDIIDEN